MVPLLINAFVESVLNLAGHRAGVGVFRRTRDQHGVNPHDAAVAYFGAQRAVLVAARARAGNGEILALPRCSVGLWFGRSVTGS
ncbi:MAG: hypothetical protein Q7R34_01905 [Dehalococcoidia bacterium]|nr:hypothetical protein [Dehalococcoidia bacterium]